MAHQPFQLPLVFIHSFRYWRFNLWMVATQTRNKAEILNHRLVLPASGTRSFVCTSLCFTPCISLAADIVLSYPQFLLWKMTALGVRWYQSANKVTHSSITVSHVDIKHTKHENHIPVYCCLRIIFTHVHCSRCVLLAKFCWSEDKKLLAVLILVTRERENAYVCLGEHTQITYFDPIQTRPPERPYQTSPYNRETPQVPGDMKNTLNQNWISRLFRNTKCRPFVWYVADL